MPVNGAWDTDAACRMSLFASRKTRQIIRILLNSEGLSLMGSDYGILRKCARQKGYNYKNCSFGRLNKVIKRAEKCRWEYFSVFFLS